jgi:MFS family permease
MEQTLNRTDDGVLEMRAADARINAGWWGVVALFLVHGLIVSTWVSRIAAIKAGLRLSDGALGVALFGAAVGSVIAIPVTGWAVTKFGSRRAAQWTSCGFCLSLILLASSVNLATLFAALFAYGTMAGANDVAMNSHAVGVEKLFGKPTMSRFHAMFSLGGIVGASMGAFAASLGVAPTIHFVLAAAVILCVIAAAAPMMLDTHQKNEKRARMQFTRPPRALVVLSAIGFCIFLSEGAIADWTAVYIREVLNGGEGIAGLGYAVFSAAMTVFRFCGDAITTKLGRTGMIRAGGFIAACGLAAVVMADSPGWALAGFAAAGAGFSSIIPVVFAAGGRVPSVSEAVGVATVSGIGYLGFLVGPPAIGFVSEMTSLRVGLSILVVLSAIAAILTIAVKDDAPLA